MIIGLNVNISWRWATVLEHSPMMSQSKCKKKIMMMSLTLLLFLLSDDDGNEDFLHFLLLLLGFVALLHLAVTCERITYTSLLMNHPFAIETECI